MGVTASMNSDHSPIFDDLEHESTVIQTPNLTDQYFDSTQSTCTSSTGVADKYEPQDKPQDVDQDADQDVEENVADAIARICTTHLSTHQSQTKRSIPDVYIIWMDKTLIGYKASWKATKRTVDTLMTQSLHQMPLGSHKYWWSKPKSVDDNTTRYILFAQPYNNLINYPSTCTSITVQRIPYVNQVKMSVEPSYNFRPKFMLNTTRPTPY